MLLFMLKEVIWKYRIFACEVLDRHYQKRAIDMAAKKEKAKKKYAKFKKKNYKEHKKLMRYISN